MGLPIKNFPEKSDLQDGDMTLIGDSNNNYKFNLGKALLSFIKRTEAYTKSQIDTFLLGKQPTLVSGTNIKTINNQSLLGSGNINIPGGGGGSSSWSDITDKPFETIGDGLTVENNQLKSNLIFNTTYDPSTNKAATMADIQAAIVDAMNNTY